jgi:hypothetical protein
VIGSSCLNLSLLRVDIYMISNFFTIIYSAIIKCIDGLRGEKFYYKIDTSNNPKYVTYIKFITMNEQSVSLKIQTHRYETRYSRCNLCNKKFDVYEVIGFLPESVNKKTRELYLEPLFFPKFLSNHIDERKQVEAVVNAFLEIKRNEFKKHN